MCTSSLDSGASDGQLRFRIKLSGHPMPAETPRSRALTLPHSKWSLLVFDNGNSTHLNLPGTCLVRGAHALPLPTAWIDSSTTAGDSRESTKENQCEPLLSRLSTLVYLRLTALLLTPESTYMYVGATPDTGTAV